MRCWMWLFTAGTAGLVFFITLIPSHNAFGVLYIFVIMLAAQQSRGRILWVIAGICLTLEIAAFLIVNHGENFRGGGTRITLSITATIIFTIITIRNRKARESLEERSRILARADRIKTLGQMALTIAHEVNQPLSAIATFAQSGSRWLRSPEPDIGEALSCLSRIDANAMRAAEVIRNVREMISSRQVEDGALIDLKKVVKNAVSFVEIGFPSGAVDIQKFISRNIPFIFGNETEIQQLIINILINAIEATLQAKKNKLNTIKILISFYPEKEKFVLLQVKDSGDGFEFREIATCFEPFYTTKLGGMGLGLAICQTIAEAHHGSVTAENIRPYGAMITVRLPAVQGAS